MACGGRLRTARADGRVRRRCSRCGWIFYDNPIPASVAIVAERGRILLARRAKPPYAGMWDLPGGFLEAGETPEEGMQRELREELGVRAREIRFLGFAKDRYGRAGCPILATVYRVRLIPGRIRPADDVTDVRWYSAATLPFRAIAFPSIRRALRNYVRATRTSRQLRAGSSQSCTFR